MEVGVLGPVEIVESGARVAVDAPKERALVATLALNVGTPVSVGSLVQALWGDDPPATADKTLQSHVSKLRKLLGPDFLISEPAGYTLLLEPAAVDAHRFEELVDAGETALRHGEPRSASALLAEALDLWRGDPLTDLADGELRTGQSTRLQELRLLAIERRVEAELALGHHNQTVGQLEALVAEHPFRESLWGHLMVALYRSGRQAEALRSFQRLRQILADELGIEPSAPIVRLESQILRQDPQLELQPPPPPHNLPVTVSSFVGRSDDIRHVVKAVDEHRLVTLVGPGGVGKTRLSLEAARELTHSYGDGVWWIDLAAVRHPTDVLVRVTTVLGATPAPGVSLLDGLASFVRVRALLLVVDNCEHVADAVADLVTHLLEAGPDVHVLATSRVPLHLPGELRRPVSPLELPPPDATGTDLALFESVRLFTDRVHERAAPPVDDDGLAAVAEICRRVDGIPLAIELAAARSPVLGPTGLLDRLPHRLDVLAGPPTTEGERYHTLRAALDWSYDLLDEREKRVFDRLAVFPGDFDLAAAEAVASIADVDHDSFLDVLSRLVDASMIAPVASEPDERRFRLLETMAEYGLEHLGERQLEELHGRHSAHYRALAREAGAGMDGPHEAACLARIEQEDHNVRTAVGWSLQNEPRTTTLEFASAIGVAWFLWGDVPASVRVLETMLEDDGSDPGLRSWALCRLIWPAVLTGDFGRGLEAADQAIELARVAGDQRLRAILSYNKAQMLLLTTGDIDEALRYYNESLALCEEHGLAFEKVMPIVGSAQALGLADRTCGVAEMLDAAEPILTDAGDHNRLANLYMDRAILCFALDDSAGVVAAATRGIHHSRAIRSTNWEQANLFLLGEGHLFAGDLVQAEGLLLQAARLALDDGNTLQVGVALQGLSGFAAVSGRSVTAAQLLGASTTLVPFWPVVARRVGGLLDAARDELGDRFDTEVAAGTQLTPGEAVALALSGT